MTLSGGGRLERRGLALGFRRVHRYRCANQSLQRLLIELLAFTEVDRTPRISLHSRVAKPGRILDRRALGEGHLHDALVGLAGTYDSVVRPHRDAPLPFLDDLRIGFLDQRTEPAEHLAAPVG